MKEIEENLDSTNMCIDINDSTRIYELDVSNIAVQQKRVHQQTKEVTWISIGYYSTLTAAFQKLLNMSVKNSGKISIADAIKLIQTSSAELQAVLNKYNDFKDQRISRIPTKD